MSRRLMAHTRHAEHDVTFVVNSAGPVRQLTFENDRHLELFMPMSRNRFAGHEAHEFPTRHWRFCIVGTGKAAPPLNLLVSFGNDIAGWFNAIIGALRTAVTRNFDSSHTPNIIHRSALIAQQDVQISLRQTLPHHAARQRDPS